MRRVAWAVAACLCGCAQTDPYMQPGMWQPTGANALNLAAMVADPQDLVRGHGMRGYGAAEAVPPVTRLFSGKAVPLPSDSTQGGPAGPSAAPAAAPGQGGT